MIEQAPPTDPQLPVNEDAESSAAPAEGKAAPKAKAAPTEEKEKKKEEPDLPSNKAIFGKSFEINLSKELKEYSNAYTKAYETKGINGDTANYITFLCNPSLSPRIGRGNIYTRINGGPSAYLVSCGVVEIPKKGESYCFIYRDDLGQKVFGNPEGIAMGWKAERVLEKIVTPVITVLKDMHDVDMVHGSIRLDNFYDGGNSNYDHILIGDCLSLPPSLLQPAIYEPLHRCSAQPTGRGPGLTEDDLYSLGVCIAMLMRTTDPMAGKKDEEIINNKIQEGTYATLIHKDDRFTGAILELLRGLLIDDQKQRWSMDDVIAWLDGRRLSPKQTKKRKRASRQLSFRGNGYFFMEAFANDMFKKPSDAVHLIECGELEQWILRSIEAKEAVERLENAIISAEETGKGSGYWDRLLARVAIAMDPEGPIRYKELSLRPEGIGIALAESYIKDVNIQSFVDIFNSQLLSFWLVTCADMNTDVSAYLSKFENCKEYIKRPMIGFGLERCLYFMNTDVHCISSTLKGFFARNSEDVLMAFEKMAQRKNRPALVFDRHIAAFLSVRDGKVIESYLYDLNSSEPHRKIIGILNILSMIQKTTTSPPTPNLTKWICESLNIAIARYHDKVKRDEIQKRIKKAQDTGDLSKIVHIIDNPETILRDFTAFKVAMHDYRTLAKEQNILEKDLDSNDSYGNTKGRQVGVIVSGILASVITMCFILVHFNNASNGAF